MTDSPLVRLLRRRRRLHRWWALVSLLIASMMLGACGTDRGPTASAPTTPPPPTEAAAAFPVTIEHKYGSTELTKAPERVVTVGLTDHDAVLALGVTPIAVRDWFGNQAFATWPWARDELGTGQPVVLSSGELNFEQIAGLRPDLILGVYSGLTDQEYATLSRIAPTVAQAGVDFAVPWQEQTVTVGRALGRVERAEQLVAEVESRFAEARRQHPEFQGARGIVALFSARDANYYPYGLQDNRARFLHSLGFQLPREIADLTRDAPWAQISREQLGLLDADVLVWIVNSPAERERIESEPLYQQLKVVREGRDLFLLFGDPLAGAVSFSSVLSLPFALDQLVPQLAAAVDGNPATQPTPGS